MGACSQRNRPNQHSQSGGEANALPPQRHHSFLWGLSVSSAWLPLAADWILEISALLREGGALFH